MKKIIVGAAMLMAALAAPASGQSGDFHIQYTYLNADGSFAGRFTVYCNGFEVLEGMYTDNYRVIYGYCDAM